jgi:hypothetical protein
LTELVEQGADDRPRYCVQRTPVLIDRLTLRQEGDIAHGRYPHRLTVSSAEDSPNLGVARYLVVSDVIDVQQCHREGVVAVSDPRREREPDQSMTDDSPAQTASDVDTSWVAMEEIRASRPKDDENFYASDD